MNLHDILNKPLSIFIDEDLHNDIVKPNTKIDDLAEKLIQNKNEKYLTEMILVYLDENNKVLSFLDIEDILDLIQNITTNYKDIHNKTVSECKLFEKYKFDKSNDTINLNYSPKIAFDIFKERYSDVILVLDDEDKPNGKIVRRKFLDTIKSLLSDK